MTEAELLKRYDKYISQQARSYMLRCNQPESLYDDLKSEATIAFLNVIRKWNFSDSDLSGYQYALAHNAIRSAMRRCVWNANGAKNQNNSFELKCLTFTDVTATTPDFDDSKLDFLLSEDDYSDFEVQDVIDRLPDVERETLNLLLRGYSKAEISRIRHVSPTNVTNTINRLRTRLKDIA